MDVRTRLSPTQLIRIGSCTTQSNMAQTLTRVAEHLSKTIDSNRVTPALVMDAINHLKNNRSDPIKDFTSGLLKKRITCTMRAAINVI